MMITGDHAATAAAIARKVNIITAPRVCGFDYIANLADGLVVRNTPSLPPSLPPFYCYIANMADGPVVREGGGNEGGKGGRER